MTDTITAVAARANAADYTPLSLRGYDAAVALNCRLFWRCPRSELVTLYERNIGNRHLDIGVGSGYLLDRSRKPVHSALTLLDLNPNCLAYTAKRLSRYDVTTAQGNVLEPFPLPAGTFDSAALNLMLHCVPGDFTVKAVAFDHAAACVRSGGRLFGSTVLAQGVPVSRGTRMFLRMLNRRGTFNNAADSLEDLRTELERRFDDCVVTVHGCTALFEATVR